MVVVAAAAVAAAVEAPAHSTPLMASRIPWSPVGRIFVVRHGQTTHNADGIIQGPRIDAELSRLGIQQARAVADALSSQRLKVVFSSPLSRARDTAQAIVDANVAGPSLQVVPEIYEMDYGMFSGRRLDEVRGDVEQVLDAWQIGFADHAFPGGESAVLAQHRIRPFVQRIMETPDDVAVVAHGRINRIIIATLTGTGLDRLESFPQSNAAINEFTTNPVSVVRLNDTAHLDLDTAPSFS